MKIRYWLLAMSFIFLSCGRVADDVAANYGIIPMPNELAPMQGVYVLQGEKTVAVPSGEAAMKVFHYLEDALKNTSVTLKGISETGKADICLSIDNSLPNEAYTLEVSSDRINISSNETAAGFFYGVQSLLQLMPAAIYDGDRKYEGKIRIPAVSITDAPRFPHRGAMMDVGRNFLPKEEVLKFLDLMAFYKLNKFHFHLTDDQGWRIEIKKYPKLTEIGAWRDRTVIGRNTEEYDNTRYGGFYTQEQAKEIVKYAEERYITVIPEVDLPGHMLAALAAYPEMGCTGGPYEVCPRWGVFEDVLCIGNEKSMQFLEDVMAEIIDIFPSKYIHIGGDEAPRTRWEKCPKCQARIRTEKLKSDKNHTAEDRLQSYCMTRIEKFLNSKGRRIIGWDEILEGDVAPNATVMSWRGSAGGIKAAQLGHDVIMTPNDYCYFDYYQSEDTRHEPFAIGGFVPLEKVYSLNPTASLTEEQAKHILGAQANLWTEYIPTSEQVEYMVLPRMAALAEVQWTQQEKKDYTNFTTRLAGLISLYRRDGLNYREPFRQQADSTATEKK